MPWVTINNGGTLGLAMDQLKYKYYYTDINNIKQQYDPVAGPPTTGVKSITNQLASVKDDIATAGGDDIKNQADKNYEYDAIGNLTKDIKEGITNITWNVYGKIQSITKTNPNLTTTTIGYTYDASGNRISKTVNGLSTFYVRDASGNTMAVYESNNNAVPQLKESHLYGSSRLGMATQLLVQPVTVSIAHGFGTGILSTFTRGEKIFELSNHLGNVLVTVSDKKIGVDVAPADGIIDYYNADVVTAADYYPFGMQMPGRKYTQANSNYRYGFNGKENDNEVKGEGNQQDYGFRIYDPRIGRFLSVDPLTQAFPWYSSYQFAGNMPIAAIDLDGAEQKIMIKWHNANGDVTRTKIVKADFTSVNQLYQTLSKGLTAETNYTLEGTKFNSTNAHFVDGFEDYKKGTGNPRSNHNKIRPNNGILTFDINVDGAGKTSVKISFDNAPINEKELCADAIRGAGKVGNFVGNVVEGAGYVASVIPGGQAIGVSLIAIGKGVGLTADVADIGADLVEGKKADASIRSAVVVGQFVLGAAANKIPIQKIGQHAIDTYFDKGTGAMKDGYFDNRTQKVEESDKLDLKIEKKE